MLLGVLRHQILHLLHPNLGLERGLAALVLADEVAQGPERLLHHRGHPPVAVHRAADECEAVALGNQRRAVWARGAHGLQAPQRMLLHARRRGMPAHALQQRLAHPQHGHVLLGVRLAVRQDVQRPAALALEPHVVLVPPHGIQDRRGAPGHGDPGLVRGVGRGKGAQARAPPLLKLRVLHRAGHRDQDRGDAAERADLHLVGGTVGRKRQQGRARGRLQAAPLLTAPRLKRLDHRLEAPARGHLRLPRWRARGGLEEAAAALLQRRRVGPRVSLHRLHHGLRDAQREQLVRLVLVQLQRLQAQQPRRPHLERGEEAHRLQHVLQRQARHLPQGGLRVVAVGHRRRLAPRGVAQQGGAPGRQRLDVLAVDHGRAQAHGLLGGVGSSGGWAGGGALDRRGEL
mmetsp:Transcript_111938/g.317317  ORF Transcript_111938/g.317317 Transcript_111938/m.317317 type:complete len:401 (+) Transcript_111938:501-1703(+)